MKKFMIRTSYAGVENRKRDLRNSERISKRFPYSVLFVADKGVGMSMTDVDFASFERAMTDAGIGYLIDKEIDLD